MRRRGPVEQANEARLENEDDTNPGLHVRCSMRCCFSAAIEGTNLALNRRKFFVMRGKLKLGL